MRDNNFSMKPIVVAVTLIATLSSCSGIPERRVIQDKVDVSTIPNAVPKMEPLSQWGNPESYVRGGKLYWIIPNPYNYKEKGIASWYGPKFQGKRTSNGETYDMYKMTAAHKTLPLPTFVRVTNLTNNNTIVVRINDRGPFKDDRIIDLSYAAAKKLDIIRGGTGQVEIRVIDPMQFTDNKKGDAKATPLTQSAPLPVESIPPSGEAQAQPQSNAQNAPPTGNAGAGAGVAAPTGSMAATGMQGMAATEMETTPQPSAPDTAPNKGSTGKIFVQVGAFGNAENAARLQAELSEIQSQNVFVDSSGGPQGIIHRVQIGPFNSEEEARKQEAPLKNHGIEKFQIIRK